MIDNMHNEENLGVSIILINSEGKIVLGERKNSYKAGFLGTPGGHVELTESLVAAAKRELIEETGVSVADTDLEYIGVVRELQNEGTNNFVHFGFVVRDFNGEVKNTEPHKCKEWIWFASNDLPKYILPGHKAIIEMFLDPNLLPYQDLIN